MIMKLFLQYALLFLYCCTLGCSCGHQHKEIVFLNNQTQAIAHAVPGHC